MVIWVWGGRRKGELNGDFQISSSKLFSKMVPLSKMERSGRDYSCLPSSSWHFLSTYYVLETLPQLLRKRREAASWVHPDLRLSLIDGHLFSGLAKGPRGIQDCQCVTGVPHPVHPSPTWTHQIIRFCKNQILPGIDHRGKNVDFPVKLS